MAELSEKIIINITNVTTVNCSMIVNTNTSNCILKQPSLNRNPSLNRSRNVRNGQHDGDRHQKRRRRNPLLARCLDADAGNV